ncbi:MAG TPA: response regulator [Candidatus Baltobacteraceae bacterium]|nr:response regulator [Candidatus Baltobacteraceae bacterium]
MDDSTEFTDILKQHLVKKRDPSWIVHTADNYSEALTCLKSHPVDLVVLDIQMPVMDGLQLLTMLKRSRPALPVVVLSGMVTPENRDYALQHGASLILSKLDVAAGFDTIYPALEATVETPAEGFKGIMHEVGLTELLQLECLARKSSVLEIKGPNADGRVYISEGAIIHAEVGGIFGEKALARLYGLKGGEFRLAPFTQPSRQTIDGHWEGLLLEAAQLCDEAAGQPAPQESGAEKNLDLEPKADAALPGEAGRRVEEVVLCSSANEILHEWQAPHAERRVKLLDWLLTKSAAVANMFPSLGRADRLEISEPRSRVMCLLQPERKMFVRLSIMPPAD